MGFDILRLSVFLLIVGGLNWGAVGLMGKDLVAAALGRGTAAKAVYVLVGLAAVYVGLRFFGLMEGFANANGMNNAGMANVGVGMREGFSACKDGMDEKGEPCPKA